MTKIAVLGAGHGGSACAVDLTLNGFDVTLCSAYAPSHIKPILEKGGLEYSGKLGEGFIRLRATTNLTEAVKEADIIVIVTPSSIHENYARLLAPILEKKRNKEQMILLNGSTTGGALFVSRILKEMSKSAKGIVCETDILNYACRLQNSTSVKIYHKVKHRLFSCFPSRYNNDTYDQIKEIFPELELAENVLQTSLSNINAILHPPGMILNAGWIENTSGNFLFYYQGVTNAVARTIDYIDNERIGIAQKLRLKTETLPELFYRYGFTSSVFDSSNQAIKSSDTIQLIQSPDKLDHRYLLDDVGYGLIPMAYIARILDIKTPTIDSLINIACILNNVNHWDAGLNSKKLGIGNHTDLIDIRKYVNTGKNTV
jgi:opine dehydrogenase